MPNAATIYLLLILRVAAISGLSAATFHVDFANGDNQAKGLSPSTAWKHAPGDPNAHGLPEATTLKPGDVIRFKGGVAYHGALTFSTSGSKEAPIILDGNSDGLWGIGPAILDGGQIIDTWRPVASAGEVGGNPLWRELYTAVVDVDVHSNLTHDEIVLHRKTETAKQAPWQRVLLIDGESGLLPITQFPKPTDPFFPDLPADFIEKPHPITLDSNEGHTQLVDPDFLSDSEIGPLDGAIAGFHAGNNHVYFGRILKHDQTEGSLKLPLYEGRTYDTTQYAVYNLPSFISKPGEWSIETLGPNKARIVLLPPKGEDGAPENVAFPELDSAITIQDGASHIQIRGFLIKRYSGGEGGIVVARSKERTENLVIENCEIRNLSGMAGVMLNYCDDITVRNCRIHHNPGWTVGIFLSRVNDFELLDNRLRKNSGSGIRHYECTHGVIRGNTLIDHHGIHSSGMNLYTGCRDILIEDNFLTDIITINRSAERLTLRNNIVDLRGHNGFCLSMWVSGNVGGRHIRDVLLESNTLVRSGWPAFMVQSRSSVPEPERVVLLNNILSGASRLPESVTLQGNLFTQKPRDPAPDGNTLITDLSKVLKDPEEGDYRRIQEGPMPQAGATLCPSLTSLQ